MNRNQINALARKLSYRVYGKPTGLNHHWTRLAKCVRAIKKHGGNYDKALKEMLNA